MSTDPIQELEGKLAVSHFIGYVDKLLDNDLTTLDRNVIAHLYYSDLHTAMLLGQDAMARYCPTFEKAWVDVRQLSGELSPGHPTLNRQILLAVVEDRLEITTKAFALGLVPKSWIGWHQSMREPDTDLLGWLNNRLRPEPELGGILYYATAAVLGDRFPQRITVPYIEAMMTIKFPKVTRSLMTNMSPELLPEVMEILDKRLDLKCEIGLDYFLSK